jgi:hypothetical protein
MALPFEFGELVKKAHFVNRTKDKERLSKNLSGGLSTMLISPRRWGKSSLIKQVASEIESQKLVFCFIDLFHIQDEQEFYVELSKEIIKNTSSKWEDWIVTAKEFFKNIRPKIAIGMDPSMDFDITFEAKEIESNYREVLDLAENIAKKKNIRIVICVDEFQNLSRFNDPLLFQQRLRASWQQHKNVSYCLYGSKKHMMIDIFENRNMPFYKFGDVIFLEKISTEHWVEFIQKQFKSTKRKISKKIATEIAMSVSNHSYYVQQLSLLVWYRTELSVTDEDFDSALNDLLSQNAILFSREIEGLSNSQINFLEALTDGVTSFHAADNLSKYKLGSSSNVTRIKDALEKKEIIDSYSEQLTFIDPVFELWFKKRFLKR